MRGEAAPPGTVIVTGGGSGIGRAAALACAERGAPIAVVDLDAEACGAVACAGIDRGGLAHEMPLEVWNAVIETNLTGTFLFCKYTLRAMLASGGGGSLVCTSSPVAQLAVKGGAQAYCASKGGISSLVRTLALDYAEHSIRVNAIVPGTTETPLMWAGVPADELERAKAKVRTQVALGRIAEPAEIAGAIVWLLSDAASYVTGSHLVVDGGLSATAHIET